MSATSTIYCKACATRALATWQGWPHKDAVPLLARLDVGACPSCGGTSALRSDQVTWFNYHCEFSTGLPDYWLLKIDGEITKWGLPYYGEGSCPKCKTRTIVSEMKYPNGEHELMHNCQSCGVSIFPKGRRVRPNPSRKRSANDESNLTPTAQASIFPFGR